MMMHNHLVFATLNCKSPLRLPVSNAILFSLVLPKLKVNGVYHQMNEIMITGVPTVSAIIGFQCNMRIFGKIGHFKNPLVGNWFPLRVVFQLKNLITGIINRKPSVLVSKIACCCARRRALTNCSAENKIRLLSPKSPNASKAKPKVMPIITKTTRFQ